MAYAVVVYVRTMIAILLGGSSYQLNEQISFSSVDYTVDEEVEQSVGAGAVEETPWPQPEEPQDGEQPSWTADFQTMPSGPHSTTSLEQEFGSFKLKTYLTLLTPLSTVDDGFNYCIALYDYEATAPEELTFVENQIIKLLNKSPHDVDDGWWEGMLDGQTGLFPSLVVEECRPDGRVLTPEVCQAFCQSLSSKYIGSLQEEESPPPSAPPAHTPPEVPSFMIAPESVVVTQPTPVADKPDTGNR